MHKLTSLQMKKRAQTPDAYTYTIIFRGCAEHPLPAQALAKVITIYNSMLSEKSLIKPNTIHMNAVLKMCAKADDMDALFSITAHLPEKGVRSPNNLTYTIILNAIRMHTFNSLRGNLTEVQKRKVRQKANLDARLLWEDITKRWRQGDIMIDEELICTMGRILLLGVEQDIDDILSLIEQTMNIPRQAPRLGSRDGPKIDPKHKGKSKAGQDQSTEDMPPGNGPVDANQELSVAVTDPFKTPVLVKKGTGFYPKPGQNTLSLLMSALLDLQLKEPATKYWNILTTQHAVEPDADNYHGYLRILRIARASTETVKLLLKIPKADMEIKTFRIAMSTCLRDKNNQHAFSNAGKVLDLMQTAFRVPDIQVLYNYLDVAFSVTAYGHKVHSNDTHAASKYEQGKQILRALERINPSYVNLRSLMAYGDPTKPATTTFENDLLKDSVLRLTQKMVSAHDLLMNKALVDREKYTDLTAARSKLAAFITRFKDHKESFVRPTLPSVMGKDISRYKKHLGRITNPPLQRRMAAAKKAGPEAYAAFMEDFAAGIADSTEEDKKVMRDRHEQNAQGKYSEKFAEQERAAAEGTWPQLAKSPKSPQTL